MDTTKREARKAGVETICYLTNGMLRGVITPQYRGQTCQWCDNTNAHGKLFVYGYDHWQGVNWEKGRFCSKSCSDAYHGRK